MDRLVHVDEFVVGRQEQNKLGKSYDYKKKKAVTDKLWGDKPIAKAWNIIQKESDKGRENQF